MSFSLSQKLERGVSTGHRLAVAFGVTDEIFGVSASQEGRVSPWYNYGVMAVAIPGWTLGTLVGAVSGNLLPDFLVSALWNVPRSHHTAGKEKQSGIRCCDRSNGSQHHLCSCSGPE